MRRPTASTAAVAAALLLLALPVQAQDDKAAKAKEIRAEIAKLQAKIAELNTQLAKLEPPARTTSRPCGRAPCGD